MVSGPRARVGKVTVTGDSGMTVDEFRLHAHLWKIAHVDHDTVNRALDGVLRAYQKQDRLEAEVKLESAVYDHATKAVNYQFSANRGPVVRVEVHGASIDAERIKHLIPIYQEGSVDEDLLNEGNRRLRDYYQRLGYFDARVDHERQSAGADEVTILYTVQLGPRRRVEQVSIAGNHYFSTATLMDLLSVHAADVLDRHGLYSQALVSADVSALESVYRNNGFSQVKVTPETSTPETADNCPDRRRRAAATGQRRHRAPQGRLPHRGGPAASRRRPPVAGQRPHHHGDFDRAAQHHAGPDAFASQLWPATTMPCHGVFEPRL